MCSNTVSVILDRNTDSTQVVNFIENNMKGTIGQFIKLNKNYGPWDFDLVNNSIILIVDLEKDWRQLWFIIIIYWKLIITKIKGTVLNWKVIGSGWTVKK